jgi:hypothetical protein
MRLGDGTQPAGYVDVVQVVYTSGLRIDGVQREVGSRPELAGHSSRFGDDGARQFVGRHYLVQ